MNQSEFVTYRQTSLQVITSNPSFSLFSGTKITLASRIDCFDGTRVSVILIECFGITNMQHPTPDQSLSISQPELVDPDYISFRTLLRESFHPLLIKGEFVVIKQPRSTRRCVGCPSILSLCGQSVGILSILFTYERQVAFHILFSVSFEQLN